MIPSTDIQVLNEFYPDRRTVLVEKPGDYSFDVVIRDARGNESTVTYELTAAQSPPIQAALMFYKSNQYDRAALTVTARALVSGGHPADPVNSIQFSVDGIELPSSGTFARATLLEGPHIFTLAVTTTQGNSATTNETIVVNPNRPPTCSIEREEYLSSWAYTARCNDTDGYMVAYAWTIDGEPLAKGGTRVTISKYSNPMKPIMRLVGYDDSGDPSPEAASR
jgi:hypothetical protein